MSVYSLNLIVWLVVLAMGVGLPFALIAAGVKRSWVISIGILVLVVFLFQDFRHSETWGLFGDAADQSAVLAASWSRKIGAWVFGLWFYSFLAHMFPFREKYRGSQGARQ